MFNTRFNIWHFGFDILSLHILSFFLDECDQVVFAGASVATVLEYVLWNVTGEVELPCDTPMCYRFSFHFLSWKNNNSEAMYNTQYFARVYYQTMQATFIAVTDNGTYILCA